MARVYVSNKLHNRAKKRQKQLADNGIHRSLFECAMEVCSGDNLHASLNEVKKALRDAQNSSSPSSQRRSGGWLY